MKPIAPVLALMLTLTTTAIAQQPRRMMPHDGPGGPGGPRGPRPDIAAYLGLNADQKVQFEALHDSLRDSIEPLLEQRHAADEQLRSLIETPTPDATAVGKQFLAIHAIDEKIKAAHEATKAKIEAMLTAEQRLRFDALHAAREMAGPPPPRPPR